MYRLRGFRAAPHERDIDGAGYEEENAEERERQRELRCSAAGERSERPHAVGLGALPDGGGAGGTAHQGVAVHGGKRRRRAEARSATESESRTAQRAETAHARAQACTRYVDDASFSPSFRLAPPASASLQALKPASAVCVGRMW